MEVRSVYKYARISPKKARDVAREIQGLPVSDAIDTLNFTPKKAAFLIGKTLKSAVANAENNHDLAADSLHVKEANISDGPSFNRYKPRARGSASAIRKRTSHIYIILTDEMKVEEKPARDRKPKSKKKPAPKAKEPEIEETEEEVPATQETDDPTNVESAPVAEETSDEPEAEAVDEVSDIAEEVSDESAEGQKAAEEEKKED
ncbi:MAG TPA: 50S ribosomal protein L22 [Verrucomicrobiales bacterium]|jgi:large subunit ribosomal protein L22|nr:50S ribosomal protein L22 [Verrucomicrobiales bacterium]